MVDPRLINVIDVEPGAIVEMAIVHKSYPFNQLNACCQIQAKIDECPLNAFSLVLFLFKDEHVMVEELLESLIDEVDPQLLEAVELKYVHTFEIFFCLV